MALATKEEIRQLKAEPIDTVWPGDSAVDLEASDLMAWCKAGGMEGLVIKPGEEPTVFKLRALSDRAYRHVATMLGTAPELVADEAFRFGLLGISDKTLPIIPTTIVGMRAVSDATLDVLGEFSMDLYEDLLDNQWVSATRDDAEDLEDAGDVRPVSLPRALGVQILAATFRARRRDR